jgi:hypothetical protein
MFSRMPGLRAIVALLGAFVPLAPGLISGCGSSDATRPVTAPAEGGPAFVTVVTGGGGVQTADAAPPDPGGPASGSDASDGSPEASDDGSSDGSPSSDGGDASGPCTSNASGDDASTDSGGASYVGPVCGSQAGAGPCDLRSNTCCLTSTLEGTCLPCANAVCPSSQATVHCLQSLECPAGQSCCGDILTLFGEVKSSCVTLGPSGTCPFVPWTTLQLGMQLCKTDAECKNGQPCIHQTCTMGAMLDMCGLQSAAPLNCQ